MTREWQPGDVAMVSAPGLDERRATWATDCPKENHPASPHWHIATRNTYLPAGAYGLVVRPLVVIDPDDREQVEALADIFCAIPSSGWVDQMQAALRSLADPPSPRPDEPQGLGAVVEDSAGKVWFRMSLENQTWPGEVWQEQYSEADRWSTWSDIASPSVLSPGYDPEATS